ncbi:unnamed protein product [Didymodactylos carnosus]|nr:unnamed protein product [Didymodactylos carnosus]CAF3817279.1 unnamed protein product [Didymodactylos carnosus]
MLIVIAAVIVVANSKYEDQKLISLPAGKRYGLLSIDGGGVRGIIAGRIIHILEEEIGKSASDLFDFAAGCSTGGILVLSTILRKTSGSNVTELYRQLAKEVFPNQRRNPLKDYSARPLERLLKEHFGDLTMVLDGNIEYPKVFVVAKYNTHTSPYLLTNYNSIPSSYFGTSNWTCWEAARATSAAPSYFPPFVKNGTNFTDGGVGFNNPVVILYEEALRMLSEEFNEDVSHRRIAYVVSIGTGRMPDLSLTPSEHKIYWQSRLAKIIYSLAVVLLFKFFIDQYFLHKSSRLAIFFFVILMATSIYAPPRIVNYVYKAWDLVSYTTEQVTDAHETHLLMKKICKRTNIPYFRFSPVLKEREDMTDTKHLEEWISTTDNQMKGPYYTEKVAKLKRLILQR